MLRGSIDKRVVATVKLEKLITKLGLMQTYKITLTKIDNYCDRVAKCR